MDNTFFQSYKIEDRSYVSFVKREIHNLTAQAGFSPMRAGEIDIIVSELTSNLIKHTTGGELIYRLDGIDSNRAFEIYCIDNGPGTNDIGRMMKDGASSANTLGHGLGSINRLSDQFQIYSMNNWGTVAYSKSYRQPPVKSFNRNKEQLYHKILQVCMPGERVCGDGVYLKKIADQTHIFLGDGLGHGVHAFEAVQKAIEAFMLCTDNEPVEALRFIHHHVKKTRGLVATVLIVDHVRHTMKVCGVGNITTRFYQGLTSRNYMPYNGILGLNIPGTMNALEIEEEKHQCIVMFSDGIRSRVDLGKYPSILKYDPAIIASAIFKDNARRNDDMTVFVGRIN